MTPYKITIDHKSKCKRCGKGGAANGGFCMSCILKNLDEGKYDHILKKHRLNRRGK
jgi:hypothetical protein